MKSAILASLMIFALGFTAQANDGGFAAIKVNDIRMREYKYGSKGEEEVRRISKPNFRISFSGGEAKKLQQILPSNLSFLTETHPEIKKDYDASFKTLGIYSDKTDVTSKVISISCSSMNLKFDDSEKPVLTPKETECTIQINHVPDDQRPDEWFGDIAKFAPKCGN